MYRINIADGYIHGVVKGVSEKNANCTEEDYNRAKAILENTPDAPNGYYYRLKENLEWELVKIEEENYGSN